MIAKVREVALKDIACRFAAFNKLVDSSETEHELVALMKELVPEFISNNSVFEHLDASNGAAKVFGMGGG